MPENVFTGASGCLRAWICCEWHRMFNLCVQLRNAQVSVCVCVLQVSCVSVKARVGLSKVKWSVPCCLDVPDMCVTGEMSLQMESAERSGSTKKLQNIHVMDSRCVCVRVCKCSSEKSLFYSLSSLFQIAFFIPQHRNTVSLGIEGEEDTQSISLGWYKTSLACIAV